MKKALKIATILWIAGTAATVAASFFFIYSSAIEDYSHSIPDEPLWSKTREAIVADALESSLAVGLVVPSGIYLLALIRIFFRNVPEKPFILC